MADLQQLAILKHDLPLWNIRRTPISTRGNHNLEEVDLSDAELDGAKLVQAELCIVNLGRAKLSDANLREANFSKSNLSEARLLRADLSKANFSNANLNGANLSGANLSNANLSGANLSEANFSGANLSQANLYEANLSEANLSEANLHEASLIRAFLTKVNASKAQLDGASLLAASLASANLSDADLSGTDLRSTDLTGASFVRSILMESNFLYARVGNTVFGNLDLSSAKRLAEITHHAPSVIGMDTIAKSKGKIPRVFLQGCGLSDLEIELARLYDPDLQSEEKKKNLRKIIDLTAHQALQASPLFISYSHADSLFVDKLESRLNKKGIRFWRDIHEMKAGKLEKQIDKAISQNSTVLLVLSKFSLSSDWVQHEVLRARGFEKETGRDMLCPVALDDSWNNSPWERHIMEQILKYNILDFSAWEDDIKFDEMFHKLIDGLELFY